MPVIDRIRDKIRTRDYYLSSHAEEELAADGFDRDDLENAIFCGFVEKKMSRDPRGTRFRVEGPSRDGRLIHALCRFKETGPLIVITAYEKE